MVPIVAFVGSSGVGKTTLLKKLISVLKKHGYRVGAIKHTHHEFEIDKPGKDSYELKVAGAESVCILSSTKLGLVHDLTREFSLREITEKFFSEVDIVLAEGFKEYSVPQVAVVRTENQVPKVTPLIAVVSELERTRLKINRETVLFGFAEVDGLAEFLEKKFLK
ncbi:molybdopterin-guanine dinucleotide biosynthesis protein B [Candidatus Acetothermia bacterium]|nr:molybdopterin-guanine dinucleotide biosynthesis protein B [Candidatus Acetothermia bacterium]MBI3661032.1 molybdopterin-guanine dinucleotide biosynthesis protein B [Candidatus Acetothermia bacterium]